MKREFTCIVCPNGCEIEAEYEMKNDAVELVNVSGNLCKRGAEYVRQELVNPERTIASSVLVSGGELPLCSVRLNRPVPKGKIFDVMKEIKELKLSAPVSAGTVLIHDVLGLGSDVVVTKSVEKAL